MPANRLTARVAALLGGCCLLSATFVHAQALPEGPAGTRVHHDGDLAIVLDGGASGDLCREDFDRIDTLYAEDGWLRYNRSAGTGDAAPVLWDYGNQPTNRLLNFGGHSGQPHTRVLSAGWTLSGSFMTNSSWLLTPEIDFAPGMRLSFWTRAAIDDLFQLPERLYVRACSSGDCSDVGAGPDDVGAFTQQLAVVNEALVTNEFCYESDATACNGFPLNWTRVSVALPESGRGRVAIQNHYPLRWGGGWEPNGNGVVAAVDTVQIDGAATCPLRHNRLFAHDFEAPANRLIQNHDPANVTLSGAVCWQWGSSTSVRRNAWFRRFRLAEDHDLSGRVAVTGIDFGVGDSIATQYLPIRLYTIPRDAELAVENLTVIGVENALVYAGDSLVTRHVPAQAFVPNAQTQDLVVEVSSEYGPAGTEFLIGINQAGNTRGAYYSGACRYGDGSSIAGDNIVPLDSVVYSQGPLYLPNDAPLIIAHFEELPF